MKFLGREGSFAIVLIIITFAFEEFTGFRVERLTSSRAGDVFEKNKSLRIGQKSFMITDCSSVEGEGNAFWKNSTHCQCNYDETFFIDWPKKKAKCMEDYGQDKDDLDCDFHFNGINHVKNLDPISVTQAIGNVKYKDRTTTSFTLVRINFWNITWQILPNLFRIESDGNLNWSANNPVGLAQKYAGLLFKLDLQAQEGRKSKKSCLLLKIAGTRSYPLQDPVQILTSSARIPSSILTSTFPTKKLIPQISTQLVTAESAKKSKTETQKMTPLRSLATTTVFTAASKITSTSVTTSVFVVLSTSMMISSIKGSVTTIPKSAPAFQSISTSSKNFPPSVPLISTLRHSLPSKVPSISHTMDGRPTLVVKSSSEVQRSGTIFTTKSSPASSVNKNEPIVPSKVRSSTKVTKEQPHSGLIPTPTSKKNDNLSGKARERTETGSLTGMIAGTVVAAVVFTFVSVGVFILCRRERLAKGKNKKRKETVTLSLTNNALISQHDSLDQGAGHSTTGANNIGNPTYEEKLRLRTISANGRPQLDIYDAFVQNEDQCLEPSEPVYKEIIEDGPIYAETDTVYQPIDENAVARTNNYQSLDSTILKGGKCSIELEQAPVYHVLNEDNGITTNLPQPPIYQTLEEGTYQELACSEADANVYTGIISQAKQDPFYQEADTERGTVNANYEQDENHDENTI